MTKIRLWMPVLVTLITVLPLAAQAAVGTFTGSIVPTTGVCNCQYAPDWGCVLQLIQNGMNFVVYFATILITFFIAWAGFTYMTSGGNQEKHSLANKRILNAVIGLMIVLTSWLLVDSVMKVLYDQKSGFGPWNKILQSNGGDNCFTARANPPPLTGPGSPTQGAAGGGTPVPVATGSPTTGNAKAVVAAAYAKSHALPGYTKSCAVYVRTALAAGGYTSFNSSHPASAYEYGPYLTNQGFSPVSNSGYAAQSGDVVVFQPISGHPDGHIAIYDGSNWVSDTVQSSIYANSAYQSGSYTVYRST